MVLPGLTVKSTATMLSEVDTEDSTQADESEDEAPLAPCPVCGFPMIAIRGSRDAVCANCGFKDSCCF